MTKVLDGYAQPDIEAERNGEKLLVFIETPESLKSMKAPLKRSVAWLRANEPATKVRFVITKPRGRK